MIIYLILLLILGLNILLKVPFINIPLDRDYGIYGYHALFWLKGEKKPYRDTVEGHPPGRWFLYSFLLKNFNLSRKLFRVSNLTFLLLTNIVVFFIARAEFGETFGLISAFSFAILSSLPTFVWTQSSDEVEQVLFTALAFLGAIVANGTTWWLYYGIGIFCFLALFFKQSAYVNTFPLLLIVLLLKSTPILMFVFVLAGLVTGYLLTFLFFEIEKIPIRIFKLVFVLDFKSLEIVFKWLRYHTVVKLSKVPMRDSATINRSATSQSEAPIPISYSEKEHKAWLKRLYNSLFKQTGFFIFFGLIAILYSILPSGEISRLYPILLWLGFVITAIMLNKHRMAIHFIPLLTPFSILAGYGIFINYTLLSGYLGGMIAFSVILLVFALSIYFTKGEIKRLISLEKKGRGHIFVYDNEWEFNKAGEGVGKYLADRKEEGDQIYVWGPEYEIYLWSGCSSPTSNLFCPRPEVSYSSDPLAIEKQIVDQLQSKLPKYVVITSLTKGFERFEQLLKENYVLEGKMYGEIEIHKRKDLIINIDQNAATFNQESLVSIIMLTYNALNYTKQCLESIQQHTKYPHEIIFVDNHSTDGTKKYLRNLVQQHPNYKLIVNKTNKGFAAGNNQGMKLAKGEYILLLNNDVLVSDGWLGRMVACAEADSSIGLVGPLTNRISGLQMVKNFPYNDPKDFPDYAARIAKQYNKKYTPRRRIAGFAMLIKKDVYEKIGGLDEDFGSGNYEDDDYCLRAKEAGFNIMVAEDVFIHHFGSKSFKCNNIDYDKSLKRNRELFKKKWPEIDLDQLVEKKERLTEINIDLVTNASNHLKSGEVVEASKMFNEVLKTNPINQDALLGFALCAHQKNDNETALKHLNKLLELNPDRAGVYNLYGIISFETGDLSNAKKFLITAIEKDPTFIEAQRNLGEVLFALEDYDTGVQTFMAILENHPNDVPTLIRMAQLYIEAGQKSKAASYLEKASRLEPDNGEVLDMLKIVTEREESERSNPQPEMQDDKREAAEDSRLTCASSLLIEGEIEAAKVLYAEVLSEDSRSEGALFGLALCARQQQDNESALRHLNQLIKINPNCADAYNQSGLISFETGDLESSKTLFIAAIEKDPKFIEAQRNYGEVLLA